MPNSISLLVTDKARSEEPQILLTGDLLFVGDIGGPDLPGSEILDEQVENLYQSLYVKLADYPDHLEIYPAHGEGSLCGRGISANLIFGYLSGGIMAWLMSGRAVEQLEQTSPQQLKLQLEKSKIRIIDLRTPAEWSGGRIKWAEHFPLSDILEDNFPKAEKGEELVLQCGSGYRSNIAASIMKQAGYANVKSLAGGIFAWSNAGFPVVSN